MTFRQLNLNSLFVEVLVSGQIARRGSPCGYPGNRKGYPYLRGPSQPTEEWIKHGPHGSTIEKSKEYVGQRTFVKPHYLDTVICFETECST